MRVWPFLRSPTISEMADLNRIHIKEALGCNSERGSPQEDEELIILWFCDLHRQRGWGRKNWREERGRGRESRENKCERKILNDQNSSHKTLGLRLCLLLGAGKALQLCQLPSMLHHENTLKPQREVLNSRRDLSSIKPSSSCSVQCAGWCSSYNTLYTVCLLHCRVVSHRFPGSNELYRWSRMIIT